MEITKLIIRTDIDYADPHRYLDYSVEIIMRHCSLLINDLTHMPMLWEELDLLGSESEGASRIRWFYSEVDNTLTISNIVEDNEASSESHFTFDTIRDRDYLDVIFQAVSFDESKHDLDELVIPDTLIITRQEEQLIEIERR